MSEKLRTFLQLDRPASDKLLALLSTLGEPGSPRQLKALGAEHGLRVPKSWNISMQLKRTQGLAINTVAGWVLTEAGRNHVAEFGLGSRTVAVVETLDNLRSQIGALTSEETRRYLLEAVACTEHNFYRAAVIMSWVAAVHILQRYVLNNCLEEFNTEASRRDPKWRTAKNTDEMGRMREADFLDVIESIGVIGKSVKSALKGCLDRRNGCGHPNSLMLAELTVAHHVEVLVMNVFSRY